MYSWRELLEAGADLEEAKSQFWVRSWCGGDFVEAASSRFGASCSSDSTEAARSQFGASSWCGLDFVEAASLRSVAAPRAAAAR
jgi:hypothetical protein